jgi:Zn-dependent protease with chaperone function
MTNQKIMSKTNLFQLAFAGLCLAIALALAWTLGITLFFPDGVLAGFLVERADIIRAHVDYLMMPQFLFIFFLLFRQYSIEPPIWVVAACCYGAFFNPLALWSEG